MLCKVGGMDARVVCAWGVVDVVRRWGVGSGECWCFGLGVGCAPAGRWIGGAWG